MKKKISIGTAIVFMLLGILITFQLSYVAISKKYETKLKDINESQQQYEKIKSIENEGKQNEEQISFSPKTIHLLIYFQ